MRKLLIILFVCIFALPVHVCFGEDPTELNERHWNITLQALTGEHIKLSDYKGKYFMLHFCSIKTFPCKIDLLRLDVVYEGLSEYVTVLPVIVHDKPDDVRKFVEGNKLKIPLYFDVTNEALICFNVASIPEDRGIDSEGKIVLSHMGVINWVDLLNELQARRHRPRFQIPRPEKLEIQI